MDKEMSVLCGVIEHLLPRVGTHVRTLDLAYGKAVTNEVVSHCKQEVALSVLTFYHHTCPVYMYCSVIIVLCCILQCTCSLIPRPLPVFQCCTQKNVEGSGLGTRLYYLYSVKLYDVNSNVLYCAVVHVRVHLLCVERCVL